METGVVTPFVPTPCPAVASIRRSGINGNTKFATSCLLRPWRMSLLFVEVELMETSEYLSDTQLCVQSLLFVEVELMETLTCIKAMECSRIVRVASIRRSGINGNSH